MCYFLNGEVRQATRHELNSSEPALPGRFYESFQPSNTNYLEGERMAKPFFSPPTFVIDNPVNVLNAIKANH